MDTDCVIKILLTGVEYQLGFDNGTGACPSSCFITGVSSFPNAMHGPSAMCLLSLLEQ
jgi:hypothetical protein